MTLSNATTGQSLRQAFKILNRFMMLMWRLGLGSWLKYKSTWGQILVIKHIGRKTGLTRYAPVNYATVEGELYCTAGFGKIADWYRNIMANPEIEIWHPEGRWAGVAEDVSDSEVRIALIREVMIGSGIAARIFGMNPYTMSDERLAEISKHYRLILLRRKESLTGRGGPGDLAWIWLAILIGLLGLLVFWWLRR
jgi:deazaflavin-dependent oxidoreductase (nitroreductase family)